MDIQAQGIQDTLHQACCDQAQLEHKKHLVQRDRRQMREHQANLLTGRVPPPPLPTSAHALDIVRVQFLYWRHIVCLGRLCWQVRVGD